jgi:hypothetical protein
LVFIFFDFVYLLKSYPLNGAWLIMTIYLPNDSVSSQICRFGRDGFEDTIFEAKAKASLRPRPRPKPDRLEARPRPKLM